MAKLKRTIASFLLLSSLAMAEEVSSFQAEAVKELYNKGILKNVVDEKNFGEKENFSRYEVATILYNTINLQKGESLVGASDSDILILKALVSDLALELGRLGAKDTDILKEIDKVEARLDDKFKKEIDRLEKKIDRIRLTSEFSLEKIAYLKETGANEKGMDELELSGFVNAYMDLTDFAQARLRYDIADEEIDSIELSLDNEYFNTYAFISDEVKLPTFRSAFGLIDGEDIDSKDGVVIEGKAGKGSVVALAATTNEDKDSKTYDIYGLEYNSKIGYFSQRADQDSNMYVALSNYTNNNGESKNLFAIGADFEFKITDYTKQLFEVEYSKLRGNEDQDGKGIDYVLPIIKDEATYLYTKTSYTSPKHGILYFSAGAVNTGRWYDLSVTGDENKTPFGETDFIKMEQNHYGGMFNIDYKFNNLEFKLNSAQYNENEADVDNKRVKSQLAYNLVPGKAKLALNFQYDTGKIVTTEEAAEVSFTADKGIIQVGPELKFTNILQKDSQNIIKAYGVDYLDVEKWSYKVYADQTEFLDDNISYKVAASYEEKYEYSEENSKENYNKYNFAQVGANIERDFWYNAEGNMETTALLGGYYKDKRYTEKKYNEADSKDTRCYDVFALMKTEFGQFEFKYGAKYEKDYEEIDGDLKEKEDQENFKYGLSIGYKYSQKFETSVTYGPVDISTSDDFILDRTDGLTGEQNQVTLKISGRL